MRKRSFSPLRDLPALAWLLFAVVVALAHPLIPDFRWLLLHAFFLGALTHSVLVWSQHFATALLRSPTNPTGQRIRLAASNLGAIGVITGILLGRWEVVAVGATAVGVAVVWHGADLTVRLGRALGSRFAVTIRFYIAAAAFLAFGAVLGVLLSRAPSEAVHARLILAHSMSNVLGWIGLTVFGTLLTGPGSTTPASASRGGCCPHWRSACSPRSSARCSAAPRSSPSGWWPTSSVPRWPPSS
jgi:nitrite reductase (NO-forming)